MQKKTAPANHNEDWSIEVCTTSVPAPVSKRYREIRKDAVGWQTKLVNFQTDSRLKSTAFAAVLWREKTLELQTIESSTGINSESDASDQSKIPDKPAGQDIRAGSGHIPLREGGVAGRTQSGQPPHPCDSDPAFSDLSTTKAMSTNERRIVIGVDTEFTYHGKTRVIDAYQFAWRDVLDPDTMYELVVMPLQEMEQRILVESSLYVASRIGRFHRYANGLKDADQIGTSDLDPRGLRRDQVVRDPRGGEGNLHNRYSIPIVLVGHFLKADLTAFQRGSSKVTDAMRRVTSAGGGLVSLKPVRFTHYLGTGSSQRLLPFSVSIRDTMAQCSQDHRSLAALGEVAGVPKLDVGESITDMSRMAREDLPRFLEYGVNDAVIVVEYLRMVWGVNCTPPVTISSGGAAAARDGILNYWVSAGFIPPLKLVEGCNRLFQKHFQGLRKVSKTVVEGSEDDSSRLSYYDVRGLEPLDGAAAQALAAFASAYHGGFNGCLSVGYFPKKTYDHDLQSAYPTGMGSLYDVDFAHPDGCIKHVIKNRELTLDDFAEYGYQTPLVAWVEFDFPEDVRQPSLPINHESSLFYPLSSHRSDPDEKQGVWCCGPELLLALKLGARVEVQIGYVLHLLEVGPDENRQLSMSLRHSLKRMVIDRGTAKKVFGKGSLEEKTIKVATNSVYGKLAQDLQEQHAWNAWDQESENVGGSAITSPYHAAMTTSLVRAALIAACNEVEVYSVTTDGLISPVASLEKLELFGIADVLRESRVALTGDDRVWEVKHEQSDLLNFSTRANASLEDCGVLARGNLSTPKA